MDLRHLKRLLEIFDSSDVTELQIEEDGTKLKMTKHKKDRLTSGSPQQVVQVVPEQQSVPVSTTLVETPAATTAPEEVPTTEEQYDAGLIKVLSPIVGSFYRAPSPESDPFVEIGTRVKPGQTLCIVEAMKLMNEIESELSGTIEKILIENGQPVEYNQELFLGY